MGKPLKKSEFWRQDDPGYVAEFGRRNRQFLSEAQNVLSLSIIRREQIPSLTLEALIESGGSKRGRAREAGRADSATFLLDVVTRVLARVDQTGVGCLCCGRFIGGQNDPLGVAKLVAAVAVALPHAARPQQAMANAVCEGCCDPDDEALRAKVLGAYREHMGMNEIQAGAA
jgi:hypothetical protein